MDNSKEMRVTKRNGQLEALTFDKILNRVRKLGQEANVQINYQSLVMKVIDQLYDTIPTTKIDELAGEQCAVMSTNHPDFATLAGRIVVSNHQKNTVASFSQVVHVLYSFTNVHGQNKPLVSEELYTFAQRYAEELEAMIDYNRDYLIDYFGFKTLERAYLFRVGNKIVERPQHMWMRVAIGIHASAGPDALWLVKESYDLMSLKYFTHATPTLFNAGTPRPQLSSCYLIAMEDDSLEGIYNTLHDCAMISKYAGGIGLHVHNVRAKGSHIQGTNGKTDGLVPMLRVYNSTARYVNQSGKRNGSFAIYLEPWHPDVEDFLEMKKNHGDEESKARDLFYALWVPDLFMERVKANGTWSLFCPNECPGLSDAYGPHFVNLYHSYEEQGKARKTVSARELWFKILDAQMETGTPYLLYKDACNQKSNQQNLGTIKSSNLCVAPDTLVLTNMGHLEIQQLVDQTVTVWNGEEWSEVAVHQTGTGQQLLDVYTTDGCKLTCTPYHKFYIRNRETSAVEQVEAKELQPADELLASAYPVIDGHLRYEKAYTKGFYSGNPKSVVYKEQTFTYKYTEIDLYVGVSSVHLASHEQYLLESLDHESVTPAEYGHKVVLNVTTDDHKVLPPANSCLQDKLDWFAGYCDAAAKINQYGQFVFEHEDEDMLLKLKLFLQTCGVNPTLEFRCDPRVHYMPHFQDQKHLRLTQQVFGRLVELGMKLRTGRRPQDIVEDAPFSVQIDRVVNNYRVDDTYCFTEPKRHMGIFNGMLTGQCTEIIEYSNEEETAVCNLASIALPTFVDAETKQFNYDKLHEVTKVVTKNLNTVIDVNFYPTKKTERSNKRHRPIGIGVQGLADAFVLMDIPFHSEEAKEVNKWIFETIYHAALERSNEIAKERMQELRSKIGDDDLPRHELLSLISEYEYKYVFGQEKKEHRDLLGAYSSFVGSPASQGILQFDLWHTEPTPGRYDWDQLKQSIVQYGLRNSLLLAPMPTASTSQILGFNECFEPFTSNLYSRRTIAGEFVVVNKYLMKELIALGYWNEQVKNNIIANKGSIQQLTVLPEHVRNKYKIVWEMPMKHLIDMSADRGAFICQSQSLNLWIEDPTYNTLTSMHFYSWKKGLKTGIYYLRRKAKHQAQQFTIEPELKEVKEEKDEICEMCSA